MQHLVGAFLHEIKQKVHLFFKKQILWIHFYGRSVYTKNNNSTYIMVVYQLVCIF